MERSLYPLTTHDNSIPPLISSSVDGAVNFPFADSSSSRQVESSSVSPRQHHNRFIPPTSTTTSTTPPPPTSTTTTITSSSGYVGYATATPPPASRDLSHIYRKLQRGAWQLQQPRLTWMKRLIALNDTAGILRLLDIRGRGVSTSPTCAACSSDFSKLTTRVMCRVCHKTVCSTCCSSVACVAAEDSLAKHRIRCCSECATFIEECRWRCSPRPSLLPVEARRLWMLFGEVAEIHTWLWKDGAQLEGLLRLLASFQDDKTALDMFPGSIPTVIDDVTDILSTCTNRLQRLLEECRDLKFSETKSPNERIRDNVTTYIVLILLLLSIVSSGFSRIAVPAPTGGGVTTAAIAGVVRGCC
eukprot:GHVS01085600.1.p1 GENE.GHVS01085600.1~~GHVS01085600.1.p1  ORF type:complete len:358 (-),score=96.72 GHVS01085600.1:40-1113(-)